MFSTRSGRKIKPTSSEEQVFDILGQYSADTSDDDSEDEEYNPSTLENESFGKTDFIGSTSSGSEGAVEEDAIVKEGKKDVSSEEMGRSPTVEPKGEAQTEASKGVSPEMVAPLMLGFGQTRSGRKVVPSQNFDILYLATKFGVNPDDSDDSNDADFAGKEGPSFDMDSDSEGNVGEEDSEGSIDGEVGDEMEEESEGEAMEVGEEGQHADIPQVSRPSDKTPGEHKEDPFLVCSICLQKSQSDEVVVCDKCGWSAHEDCYGILPSDSEEDGEEIVPWFCDGCKAGFSPMCELCPNTGGLFKQTVNGKWVHTVCCLYTPGVSYLQPSQLSCVVLDEISPIKWGQKTCMLCETALLARTGVCVQCDAGMCRSAFHVTCALKSGLLCEVDMSQEELDKRDSIVDAYFAHCKVHSKKEVIKKKKARWQAAASQQMAHKFNSSDSMYTAALKRASKAYFADRQSYIAQTYEPANVDLVQERFLHNSPTAMKLFARKAEKMGLSIQDGRKASDRLPKPALTVEYVQFYNESLRELLRLSRTIPELVRAQAGLDHEQRALLERSVACDLQVKETQAEQKQVFGEITELCSLWELPVSPQVVLRGRMSSTSSSSLGFMSRDCCVCNESANHHLMVSCDTCRCWYHIGCLDPPLKKVPKKTKTYGWQCEECCCSDQDSPRDPPSSSLPEDSTLKNSTRTGRRVVQPKCFASP